MSVQRHRQRSYRAAGRAHLAQAQTLLDERDERSLIYAVLELRMALEAHVYATAETYVDELPERRLSKWQPPSLLRELLTIDPQAANTGTLRFARETEPGVPGTEWIEVGTQKRMTLKEIDAVYHKLGKFLHIETVLDKSDGKVVDYERLRESCVAVAERLSEIFSASLHNLKMGVTSELSCYVCARPIKRRLTTLSVGDKVATECGGDCYATYVIELLPDEKVLWTGQFNDIPCTHEGCTGTVQIWERHLKPGNSFACDKCGKASEIQLGIQPVPMTRV